MAEVRQRNGQIDGNGGLADAAFAGADRDQILDAGNRRFRLRRRADVGPIYSRVASIS